MLQLAIVVAVLVTYALFTRRIESRVSGPMVFMTVGVLISEPFLDWFPLELGSLTIQVLLHGALALVLFIEASTLGLRREINTPLPSRLLIVAMPLVMIGGLVFAAVLFGVLSFWEAAVVGTLLAPTDAALGLAVVENERVPARIRSALVVEGGLNDGLAVPFVLFAAGFAEVSAGERTHDGLFRLLLEEMGVAVLVGIGVGWLAAVAASRARSHRWATDGWIRLAILGFAIISFALADGLHGSGFISVWVSGLVFGRAMDSDVAHDRDFSENGSHLLVVLSFLVFGSIAVGPLLSELTWEIVVYAVVSLAVVRPVAVILSMLGSGEKLPTTAFMGWFGPRGLPSLVLVLILLSQEFVLPNSAVMLDIVVFTVAISVYLHGITAEPLADRYADWCETEPVQT